MIGSYYFSKAQKYNSYKLYLSLNGLDNECQNYILSYLMYDELCITSYYSKTSNTFLKYKSKLIFNLHYFKII